MSRALRPRATGALSVAPVTVTDRTCAAVLGFEPRPFREFLVREGVRHADVGRIKVARIEDVLSAVDRLAGLRKGDLSPTVDESTEADGPTVGDEPTADQILARIGRVRTGGAR